MPDALCTIIGSVGRDPELRFTASGKAVASFSVACSRRWKPYNSDTWEEVTTWYNVSCWEQMAENVAASIHKGTRVMLTGTPEQREYETKDGEKRTSLEFRPDEIAVSLKNAKVEVEKVERVKDGKVKDSRPKAHRQPEPVYGDEEPF